MPRADDIDLFAAAPLPVAPLDDAQRIACLRLIRSENVGPATFRALVNHFGGARPALDALPALGRQAGRSRPIRIWPEAKAEAELDTVARAGARVLFAIEPGFPAPLAFVDGAPPMIYVKGRLDLLSRDAIAIVGSRQSSAAGLQLAGQFAGAFGAAGFVVASGLARGIDAAAHAAALATGTIAVVAGGIDIVYPPEHKALQARIAEDGCLLSEQPFGYQPRAQDFPRRNRIISGVSRAVVVVEAARRSGTLITARLANEQGRDVFAVPGHPLDPRAEGTNQLLKDGAGIATCAEDVITALSGVRKHFDERAAAPPPTAYIAEAAPPRLPADTDTAAAVAEIVAVLGPAPVALDVVTRATGLPARLVQAALLELMLAGRVELHGGQLVSLLP